MSNFDQSPARPLESQPSQNEPFGGQSPNAYPGERLPRMSDMDELAESLDVIDRTLAELDHRPPKSPGPSAISS